MSLMKTSLTGKIPVASVMHTNSVTHVACLVSVKQRLKIGS